MHEKPNWNDAPDWANWLALGLDGYWRWHEFMPEMHKELDALIWVPKGRNCRASKRLDDPPSKRDIAMSIEPDPNSSDKSRPRASKKIKSYFMKGIKIVRA